MLNAQAVNGHHRCVSGLKIWGDRNDFEVELFLDKTWGIESKFGLSNDFMVKVSQAVGNYGEVYERNVGSRSLINTLCAINNL
jgi:hypothetical protein